MKTKWNLKLLYKSLNDKALESDVKKIERAFISFEKKYRNTKNYLSNKNSLLKALTDYEKLLENASGKPVYYLYFLRQIDSENSKAEALLNKHTEILTKAGNRVLFFDLNLGKINKKKQKEFLKSKKLKHFHYFLEKVFESSIYDLSESEEKIMSLKSITSRSLWIDGVEKVLNKETIKYGFRNIPLSEASFLISSLKTIPRRKLHKSLMDKLYEISDFSESEINAVYIDKKINDELRGFKEPYDSTILNYENDRKSVLNLVDTVSSNFSISRKFYKLKKEILGLKDFQYADRSIGIGKIKKSFLFSDSYKTVRDIFSEAHPRYGEIFERLVNNGQTDVFPRKGKTGGAFCAHSVGLPTLVLLNHVNDHHSLSTLSHEMGHAIHSERSKEQSPIYEEYSTSVAETASTFFETLVFNTILERLSPKEQIIALHDRIQGDIATIFRQIAVFNFEYELHKRIREEGSIPKEEIAKLMNKHMKSYIGPSMKLTDRDGYFFVYWSHIRNFFYVYSYTYGQLISKTIYSKYKKDTSYINKIDKFLTAGGSKSPEDIFGDIGINTRDPKFFEEGLLDIEKDINKLKKLVASQVK